MPWTLDYSRSCGFAVVLFTAVLCKALLDTEVLFKAVFDKDTRRCSSRQCFPRWLGFGPSGVTGPAFFGLALQLNGGALRGSALRLHGGAGLWILEVSATRRCSSRRCSSWRCSLRRCSSRWCLGLGRSVFTTSHCVGLAASRRCSSTRQSLWALAFHLIGQHLYLLSACVVWAVRAALLLQPGLSRPDESSCKVELQAFVHEKQGS